MGAGASTGGDGKPPQLTRANTAALVVAAGEASEEDIAAALKELPEETIKKVQAVLAARTNGAADKAAAAAAPSPAAATAEPPPFYPVAPEDGELNQINKVADGLFLTNWRGADDAEQRKKLGITHIAAVGTEFTEDDAEGIVFWKKDIGDDESAEGEMAESLRDGAKFINKALRGGGRCLVHCAAGISRSATVVLAYLVIHQKKSLREALGMVLAARRPVWPNDGFMRSLIALEADVRKKYGGATISIDEYIAWGDYELPEPAPEAASAPAGDSETPAPRAAMPRFMRGPTFVLEETRRGEQPALLTFESTDSIDDSLRRSNNKEMRVMLAKQVTREASENRSSNKGSSRSLLGEDSIAEGEEAAAPEAAAEESGKERAPPRRLEPAAKK